MGRKRRGWEKKEPWESSVSGGREGSAAGMMREARRKAGWGKMRNFERIRNVKDEGMTADGKGRGSGRARCLQRAKHLPLGAEKDRVFSACFHPILLAAILRISAVPHRDDFAARPPLVSARFLQIFQSLLEKAWRPLVESQQAFCFEMVK